MKNLSELSEPGQLSIYPKDERLTKGYDHARDPREGLSRTRMNLKPMLVTSLHK
jgi:hypothetical protein